ncbi:MAG: DUF3299 domain-containing protein [Flavobacteriia bacterium]|nr:DUF3299 domain-containing protein [Flavobacteriia bacterium]
MRLGILLISILTSISTAAQTTIKWADLEDVEFVEFYDRERSEWSLKAEFSDDVQALDNQEVVITGYVIPLDVSGEVYVLSAFAFSSCFFCGGAGPETVMGLTFEESPPQLKTDDVISVRGTLHINRNPGLEFHYMLSDVVITKQY